MKTLLIAFLFLTACGHSGGGDTSPSVVNQPPSQVDHSPHTYNVVFFTNDAPSGGVTFHQVCNFGQAVGFRDDGIISHSYSGLDDQSGIGAANCVNYTVDMTNTGAYPLIVSVSIDSSMLPDFTLSPSQHYTFQRGF